MVTKKKMPPRRQRIWEFVQEFYSDNGIPPTVRDIQKACEISSTSVVDYNLEKLSQAGYLNRRRDVARGIEILDQEGQPVSNAPRVQIVGAIAPTPFPAMTSASSYGEACIAPSSSAISRVNRSRSPVSWSVEMS